jgi:hypothetical protein
MSIRVPPMAVWLQTVDGERYKLAQRKDEDDNTVMRALLDGAVSGWAPVVRDGGGWLLVNLQHVVRIETGSEDGPHVGLT